MKINDFKILSALIRKYVSLTIIVAMTITSVPSDVYAGLSATPDLPVPGQLVGTSQAYDPILLKGLTIHPEDPLRFDFIIDGGQVDTDTVGIQQESQRLIKYFLAAMTVPKNDLWVNLSPYEGDKIIPEELSKTELGRDLLAQDYLLKQLTASLIYPEKELGADFWDKIYQKAQAELGTTDIPLDTFNKVWILPDRAQIYRHDNTVYVVNARMKVMLDGDYQAEHNGVVNRQQNMSADIVREVLLPVIEKEVNEGENFVALRQIYHALILAKWYKGTIQESILHDIYIDQNKVSGVDGVESQVKEDIYAQYMQAYQKGVFNYIKEDYDRLSGESLPRKYFSGGFKDADIIIDQAITAEDRGGDKYLVEINVTPEGVDNAVMGRRDFLKLVPATVILAMAPGQIAFAQEEKRVEYDEVLRLLRQPDWETFSQNELVELNQYGRFAVSWMQRAVSVETDPQVKYNALRGIGVMGNESHYATFSQIFLGYDINPLVRRGAAEAMVDQLNGGADKEKVVGTLLNLVERREVTEAHIIAIEAIVANGNLDDLNFIDDQGGVRNYYQGSAEMLDRLEQAMDVPTLRIAEETGKRALPYIGYTVAAAVGVTALYLVFRGALRNIRGTRLYHLRNLNGKEAAPAQLAAQYFMEKGNRKALLSATKHIPDIYQAMVEYYENVPKTIKEKKKRGEDAATVLNPKYSEQREKAKILIQAFEDKNDITPRMNFNGSTDEALIASSVQRPDSEVGGIDMNNIAIATNGNNTSVQFDTTSLERLLDQPVQGFAPVIINVTPIPSIMPLLGLDSTIEDDVPLEISQLVN